MIAMTLKEYEIEKLLKEGSVEIQPGCGRHTKYQVNLGNDALSEWGELRAIKINKVRYEMLIHDIVDGNQLGIMFALGLMDGELDDTGMPPIPKFEDLPHFRPSSSTSDSAETSRKGGE